MTDSSELVGRLRDSREHLRTIVGVGDDDLDAITQAMDALREIDAVISRVEKKIEVAEARIEEHEGLISEFRRTILTDLT